MPNRDKVPSLECLVNQCCEDYYAKLNKTLERRLSQSGYSSSALGVSPESAQGFQRDGYFTYDKFEDYIKSSHCIENLKFLIQIFHYEKIWNKIFKRQYSILKCKDEASQLRKHSVATIHTNNSSKFKRHMSIAEEPEDEQEQLDKSEDNTSFDMVQSFNNEDISKLVNELTLPELVLSADDIDTKSIVQTSPLGKDAMKYEQEHEHIHKSPSNWSKLFKPSYFDTEQECLCKVENHNSSMNVGLTNIPRLSISTSNGDQESVLEYNESLKQREEREMLKNELEKKFREIIHTYVSRDSPYEINLPDDIYNDLIQEAHNEKVLYHSPMVLLPAKNIVLQLLRENIYYKFLSEQEDLLSKDESLKSDCEDLHPIASSPSSITSSALHTSFDKVPTQLTRRTTTTTTTNTTNTATRVMTNPVTVGSVPMTISESEISQDSSFNHLYDNTGAGLHTCSLTELDNKGTKCERSPSQKNRWRSRLLSFRRKRN